MTEKENFASTANSSIDNTSMEEMENQKENYYLGHSHFVSNGKTTMTLDQLAELQPGMARLMVEISGRMSKCFYAGKHKNTPLARFQLSEAVKLLKMSSFVRPKYLSDMNLFLSNYIERLQLSIAKENWVEFENIFAEIVTEVNRLHAKYNKEFLVWKIPTREPEDIDFTPLSK